ncbi:hypothetical protein FRC03_001037 [Tulasnella sp. 419]|nr:hypothetical protein FRC02_011389 [Tulasnella sp. 418]KAG8965009.1 hypothetical protein FRC03_001037 [Tulasnella sp. 419]
MASANPLKNIVTSIVDDAPPQDKADESALLSPADEEAKAKLEKQLAHRPDRSELVEKNILKNSNAAPALQAAQANLERARLEDKLDHALQQRPDRSELVDKNILKNTNAAPALQAVQANLERARLEDKLDHALQQRPNPEELIREGILQNDETPSA